MKTLASFVLVSTLLLPFAALAEDDLVIIQGTPSTVTFRSNFTIAQSLNSNPKVLQATPELPNKVTFVGAEIGTATYVLVGQDKTRVETKITVVSKALGDLRQKVLLRIGDVAGIDVSVRGDQLLVQGDVDEAAKRRVDAQLADHPEVLNLVRAKKAK